MILFDLIVGNRNVRKKTCFNNPFSYIEASLTWAVALAPYQNIWIGIIFLKISSIQNLNKLVHENIFTHCRFGKYCIISEQSSWVFFLPILRTCVHKRLEK